MAVAALMICGALALTALGAVVVLRLDRNATLRSVKVKAQAWKTINIDFHLERDADKTDTPTADAPSITATKEAIPTAVSPKATTPPANDESARPTPQSRHRSTRSPSAQPTTTQDAGPHRPIGA
ncbi:hypothetical protein [Amycolatopsis sp. NPDC051071]|uniref:hypothetical protein n=1 Tax=Amycolatopsis sp. NPDC051071 TaxID=3154637 RepID=UPI003441193A